MYEFYYVDEEPVAIIDGELNPSYFRPLEPPTPEEIQRAREEQEKAKENAEIFKQELKKLYGNIKRLTITLKNGKIISLDLKDPNFGWFIRWAVRDLSEVIIEKKLGFNKYGFVKKGNRHENVNLPHRSNFLKKGGTLKHGHVAYEKPKDPDFVLRSRSLKRANSTKLNYFETPFSPSSSRTQRKKGQKTMFLGDSAFFSQRRV